MNKFCSGRGFSQLSLCFYFIPPPRLKTIHSIFIVLYTILPAISQYFHLSIVLKVIHSGFLCCCFQTYIPCWNLHYTYAYLMKLQILHIVRQHAVFSFIIPRLDNFGWLFVVYMTSLRFLICYEIKRMFFNFFSEEIEIRYKEQWNT